MTSLRAKISEIRRYVREFMDLLGSERWLFYGFILCSLLGALTESISISMIVPILETQGGVAAFQDVPFFQYFSEPFADMTTIERLQTVAGLLIIIVLIRGAIQFLILYLGAHLPLQLTRRMLLENYKILNSLNIFYIDSMGFGALYQNINNLPGRIAALISAVSQIIWNVVLVVALAVLMFMLSPGLTLAAIIFTVGFSVVYMKFSFEPLGRIGRSISDAHTHLHQICKDTITGTRFIRLCGGESILISRFAKHQDDLVRVSRAGTLISSAPQPILMMISGLFIAILFFALTLNPDQISERITQLLLFFVILMRIIGPISSINRARGKVRQQIDALDRQKQFRADARRNFAPTGPLEVHTLNDAIEFENVTYGYQTRGGAALRGVNTKISRGEMIALVGSSGAGKSTFANLLIRFDDPQSGRITVDGIDMREIDSLSWRRMVSVVSQDIFLLNESITGNLSFALDHVTMDHIEEACRLAAADDFIRKLPKAYDTVIGDRGVQLSGGQRQRLAIARAIIAEPKLLILDEATSQLDSKTESAIQVAMERLRKNCTLVVIAHRLSTIQRADRILVLDDGRLVEVGDHSELMMRRGKYWELLEHQKLETAS